VVTVTDLLALYGTLMSGLEPRPGAPELSGHIERVGECLLRGALYDAGFYPGLVDAPGAVRGELWRCLAPTALELLDGWEDYYPDALSESMYVRRRVKLIAPQCDAWVYYWNLSTSGLQPIASGDWREHLSTPG
jgi:gamma-glutamylcyclotransferase (GGCT)/AIG2-like uncharacterized protein YtfP